jgi:dTMP kinase
VRSRNGAQLHTQAATTATRPAGFLAVIDGPAGAGKTTVTALVAAALAAHGHSVLATRQPSDALLGKLARSSTQELRGLPLTFLMAADRYHHDEHVISPALAASRVVVCDRYVPTALVLDQLDGADPEFIWGIYRYLRWPDLAVILSGDPGLCRARVRARGAYSRFHHGGARAGTAEAALYDRAARLLASRGYPIQAVPVGNSTADQVAGTVTALIRNQMTAARAQ